MTVPTPPPATASAATEALCAGLNPEQAAAVRHRGGPLLVVAGPGSGKTRVLTHRIAALVRDGIEPHRLLAVTFTNKAAAEMRERLAKLLTADEIPYAVSTFHSFCVRTLRANADRVGLPRGFSVIDTGDAERLLTADGELDRKEARAMLSKISYAKNTLRTVEDLDASPRRSDQVIAYHWQRYAAALTELGALDFDDLLLRTRDLLASVPPSDPLRTRFTALLVDEWQDTNAVQYDIVKLLAPDLAHCQVCVVGDAEQSIYGWRGSSPSVVDRFVEEFRPCTVVELGQNYRSTPEIVAAAAAVAAHGTVGYKVTLSTSNASGEKVAILECADPDEEARRVVAALRSKTGTRAVLVRTNAQTRVFETALNAAGIAHQLVGMTRFTERTEVKDALAYLRLAVNPADSIAFERAINTPRRGFGKAAHAAFVEVAHACGAPLGDAIFATDVLEQLPKRVKTPVEAFANAMADVRAALADGPVAALRATLAAGVRAAYQAEPERIENLDELLVFAEQVVAERATDGLDGTGLVEAFLEAAALASSTDVDDHAPVSVITAHASKGREFDHVWVVGVEDGVFPHVMAGTDGVDEERRLFFVAVSRARSSLTVSHRHRHFVAGEWRDARTSPFVEMLEPLAGTRSSTTRSSKHASLRVAPTLRPVEPARAPGPRLDPATVVPGLVVEHPVFGRGTVVARADAFAKISFNGTTRTLDLGFAPLQVVA